MTNAALKTVCIVLAVLLVWVSVAQADHFAVQHVVLDDRRNPSENMGIPDCDPAMSPRARDPPPQRDLLVVRPDVPCRCFKCFWVVKELAKTCIAVSTQQPSYLASRVAMINSMFRGAHFKRFGADGTRA